MKEKRRKLNNDIRAHTVQLITDKWENLWEMPLSVAKQKATEENLDLIEIWRKWDVVIVKILDYWKFLYRQKKQDRKNKTKWKTPDLKTIRITFKIGDHDLEIKRKQAEKFWKAMHPLKISLMLRWRENHYSDLAREKITGFVQSLDEIYKLEWEIKKNRNVFIAMLKLKK
jgi:translation initiation factor IF-3